jgi:hypothetical protein
MLGFFFSLFFEGVGVGGWVGVLFKLFGNAKIALHTHPPSLSLSLREKWHSEV